MRLALRAAAALAAVALALTAGLSTAAARKGSRYRSPVTSRLGIVATESPAAGRVGRAVLERGGNAVDAAASVVFALNVARPQSCGIGGGGFMLYRSSKGRTAALDFRETAPAAYTPTILTPPGLHTSYTGHLTVGAPGTLAGMRAALARYGTLSLSQAIAPAERLARHGFRVPRSLSDSMTANAPRLRKYPAAARQFLRAGRAYPAGSVLRQPTLARTLRTIRRHGIGAFYGGSIARRIDADMDATRRAPIAGDRAVLTTRDIARYRPVWRRALSGRYRGNAVYAVPPPTSGGVVTLEMLNILSRFGRAPMSSVDELHRVIEAEKLAFADRNAYLADPGFVKQPTSTLTSAAYGRARARLIDPNRAKTYQPGLGPFAAATAAASDENPNGSTTHVSVVDASGNAVALTCTIEQEFGSAVVAPGTGFLLNNEMTDFGKPGTANEPRSGKRPRSSIDPLIVTRGGRPIAVTGGAGGARIIMGAFLTAFDRMQYGLPLDQAVDAERFDANDYPTMPIHVEQSRLAPGFLPALQAKGHVFDPVGEYDIRPRVQAVGFRSGRGNARLGVSDSRTDMGTYAQRHQAPTKASTP